MSDTGTTGKDQKQTEQKQDQKAVERREFLKRSAITLGAGWLGLGSVRELLASAQGISARAYAGPAGAAAIEPFRMAVVGDSVAWGQGLAEPNKYYSKVGAFVASRLNGRPVEKVVRAHSGAVIAASSEDPTGAARYISGEVPASYPSITYQATKQIQFPELIDLVLLDGGANDIGMTKLLNASQTPDQIRTLVTGPTGVFGQERYVPFLDLMYRTFPNATIVVTNYYRIVTPASDLGLLPMIIRELRLTEGNEGKTEGQLQAAWSEFCQIFDAESTAGIQRAVAAVNAKYTTSRVLFVDNGFDYNEAVGAPNRMLWNPGEQDELGGINGVRYQACSSYILEPPLRVANPDWYRCVNASIAHPNVAGAAAIASKIIAAITPLVPAWAAAKAMTVAVTPGAETTSSKTITVHAKDAATGQPLNGTVKINGVTAPTGQAFTFPKCFTTESTTADSEGPVLKPTSGLRTKTYTECGGTVSASGYIIGRFQA